MKTFNNFEKNTLKNFYEFLYVSFMTFISYLWTLFFRNKVSSEKNIKSHKCKLCFT